MAAVLSVSIIYTDAENTDAENAGAENTDAELEYRDTMVGEEGGVAWDAVYHQPNPALLERRCHHPDFTRGIKAQGQLGVFAVVHARK